MKKILHNITASLIVIAAAACSNIDEDDRLIYVKPAEVNRAVLLEDFTGQRCANCPTATALIEELSAQYGDTALIAVSIHSGPLGFAGTATVKGLMTDLGNVYYNYWKADRQPLGVIDRIGGTVDYDKWTTRVNEEFSRTTPLSISLEGSVSGDGKITVSSTLFASESITGKLQLWLLEDNITAIQTMPDGHVDTEYVHNHVLREAVNGDWGEDISIGEGQTVTRNHSLSVAGSGYNIGELCIVAFVYNDNGVIQAKKIHL